MTVSKQIMIVEPNTLFREGLRRILTEAGFHAVWCSDTPPLDPVPGVCGHDGPALIVGSEIEEASLHVSTVKRIYPHTRAIILADAVTQRQFVTALRCGAETVVLKSLSCDALIATLRFALDGIAMFPTAMIEALVGQPEPQPEPQPDPQPESEPEPAMNSSPPSIDGVASIGGAEFLRGRPGLSGRENDVLEQLLLGLSNKEIARKLSITEATVKVHVKAIFRKAQVRSRTQAIMWASRGNFEGRA